MQLVDHDGDELWTGHSSVKDDRVEVILPPQPKTVTYFLAISELLQLAQEQTSKARVEKASGKCGASQRFYEWSNVLYAMRFLGASTAFLNPAPINGRTKSRNKSFS